MSTTSTYKRKNRYDPLHQWGLKPKESAHGSTYIISGHIVNGSDADPRNMSIGEMIGREGQARAQRKKVDDVDRALISLLERDREGMKAVMLAREASNVSNVKSGHDAKVKALDKVGPQEAASRDAKKLLGSRKNTHLVHVAKQLGFDPTQKLDQQKKLENGALLKVSR